jgi:hypothetical protein
MTIEVGKSGGSALPQLAPDLTWPSDKNVFTNYKLINLDPSGGLTTALSLEGKWSISSLLLSNFTAELITIKLTVDDRIIWNDTFTLTSTSESVLIGGILNSNTTLQDAVTSCKASWLLEIQTASDSSVNVKYTARPIL